MMQRVRNLFILSQILIDSFFNYIAFFDLIHENLTDIVLEAIKVTELIHADGLARHLFSICFCHCLRIHGET